MSLVKTDDIKLFPEKDVKENPAACIFVASLNKNVGDSELNSSIYHHFKRWGNVVGVKVLKDWLKRPYAFVQFESEQDSKVALEEAPGTLIHGRSIRCEPARVNRTICLISIVQPFNKQFLQTMFAKFGSIEDVSVLQPQNRFYYAFIKYKYRSDAITAYLTLKGTIGDTKDQRNPWFIEWASNLDINNMYQIRHMTYRYLDTRCIFIGNLHVSIQDSDLKDVFQGYGKIRTIKIIRKSYSKKNQKIFAFISYDKEIETANAIEHENGRLWKDKIIRVCYREYYYPSAYFHEETWFDKQTYIMPRKRLPQQTDMGPYNFMPYCTYDLYYMGVPVEQQSSIHGISSTGTFPTTNVYNTVYHHQPYYTGPYASISYYPYYQNDKKYWNQ